MFPAPPWFFFEMLRRLPTSTQCTLLLPYPTLSRSGARRAGGRTANARKRQWSKLARFDSRLARPLARNGCRMSAWRLSPRGRKSEIRQQGTSHCKLGPGNSRALSLSRYDPNIVTNGKSFVDAQGVGCLSRDASDGAAAPRRGLQARRKSYRLTRDFAKVVLTFDKDTPALSDWSGANSRPKA
jgi:hypothetical protein